jgi:hypothetical protein
VRSPIESRQQDVRGTGDGSLLHDNTLEESRHENRDEPVIHPHRHTGYVSRTRWTYLGLALLAVGLVTASVGAATHLSERRCANAGFVRVVDTDEVTGSLDGYDRVAYAELNASERQVFRGVLNAGGQALTGKGAIREAVVAYEGDSYLVVRTEERGCAPWDRERVVAPLAGGLAVLATGLAFTRGRDP